MLLKAIYSRYRLKPSGGGLRSKLLRLDGWLQLLSDAHLVDSQFTLQVSEGLRDQLQPLTAGGCWGQAALLAFRTAADGDPWI